MQVDQYKSVSMQKKVWDWAENLREMQYLETPHGSGCFPLCCRLPWQQTLYLVMVQTQDLKKDTQRERERECVCVQWSC